MDQAKICSIDSCNKIVHSKGFCQKHYLRNYYHGDPNFTKAVKANEYPNGKKWCAKCKSFLDLNEFWERGSELKKEPYCKSCRKKSKL